jgi:hypothetical protein
VLATAAALAACGGGDEGYPEDAVDRFVEACTAQQTGTEEACRCVVDRLEERIPFDEFEAADDAVRAGREPSDEFSVAFGQAVEQCR